ncbi:MAG TPA: hypothetical protein VHC43_06220 [Mycobacteriales bacterium]|nr:hypothetical protein [Mycobacteriales bacterium]
MRGRGLRSLFEGTQRLPFFNEIAVLVLALLTVPLYAHAGAGLVVVSGVAGGAPLVLAGIGVVLVYRANRFINFSQLAVGVWAGMLFDGLYRGRPLWRALRASCGCVGLYPGRGILDTNFFVAAGLAILAAVLINTLIYVIVIRRFRRAGQLMLSLVTIYLAEALSGVQGPMRGKLVPQSLVQRGLLPNTLTSPFDVTWKIAGFPLQLADLLLIGAAAAALFGISWYLHRGAGVEIRAAAENPGRAETLGISEAAASVRMWLLSGLLAGVGGVLGMLNGSSAPPTSPTIPVEGFVIILVLVVIARFTNLWLTAAAGVVFGIVQVAVQLGYQSQAPLDASLMLIVAALLLLQRDRSAGARVGGDDFSGSDLIRELRPIPHELRDLDSVRRWTSFGRVLLVAFVGGIPWALSVGQVSVLTDYVIYALVGAAILIMSGWAGQPALGQFGFGAIGAWAAATSGAPFLLALLLGGVTGAVAAVLVGIPALRLRGLSVAVSSLAFAVSAYALFIDPRYLGSMLPQQLSTPSLFGLSLSNATAYYYFCLCVLFLACMATVGLRRTRLGRTLIALRSNEATAQAFGISPNRARLSAFAVAGFFSAVAGALLAYSLGTVDPQSFSADLSLQYFIYAAIGGLGGLPGVLMGFGFGWVLAILPQYALIQYFATGIGALLLLYAIPGGIAQGVYAARDAMLRRVAFRMRLAVPSLMGDALTAQQAGRANLDEPRGTRRQPGDTPPWRYALPGQWALDRLGEIDTEERVGV